MMRLKLSRRPDTPYERPWTRAWPIAHLIPPVVFVILIVLSQYSAASLARGAFWLWLAAMIFDEAFAGARPTPWPCGETRLAAILTRMIPPFFLIFLLGYADVLTGTAVSTDEFFAIAFICGIVGAIFAVPAAHELMHSKNSYDRGSAVFVMSIFTYPHFCIAHLLGHHRDVATFEDPATARLGESLYGFFQRSVPGAIAGACKFEAHRLRRSGHPVWSAHNRLLRYSVLVAVIYGMFFAFFGCAGVAFLAIQGVAAVFTLEAMNYVQHYGLQRCVAEDGSYGPVGDSHSWDTNHPVTNLLMLNLGYHSNHHLCAAKSLGEHGIPEGPQLLPFGYFALWWIAVWPPLWRRVMDHRVQAIRRHMSLPLSA
jgi:alkane 1-monooxygenase